MAARCLGGQEGNMYGLAAIQQANGWAMAGAGAGIVLIGLAVLSFLISMLPRVIGLFETKAPAVVETPVIETAPSVIVPERLPEDVDAAATIYISFTESLGEVFSLVDLHRKSKEIGLPHPHLSINRFRDAGWLIPAGDGLFSWKPSSE
jgi:hypothetical protein